MTTRIRFTTRSVLVAGLVALLLLAGGTLANAQQDPDLYPPPDEVPVTQVIADTAATGTEARPATGVLPSDLARTGFGIGDPLALGALLVLVGGGILAADRWYRRRLERAVSA